MSEARAYGRWHRVVAMGAVVLVLAAAPASLVACGLTSAEHASGSDVAAGASDGTSDDALASESPLSGGKLKDGDVSSSTSAVRSGAPVERSDEEEQAQASAEDAQRLRAALAIHEDHRESFVHGEKSAADTAYIVLHDTEGTEDAERVIAWWDDNGAGVAAHFIVNRDGSIWQCVPIDVIAHHAGFGDAGNNERFGVADESRDDKVGTVPIGDDYPDYGMNAYSIGIEIVHEGDQDYPEAQLEALDALIAYLDAELGHECAIIDHKAWRSTNSDTSAAFADYLAAYQQVRRHVLRPNAGKSAMEAPPSASVA